MVILMTEDDKEEVETVEQDVAQDGAKDAKKIKVKKVVRRRKTKKERENSLTVAIRLAVESGSVEFGTRTALAASDTKPKLLVIAGNIQDVTKSKVESFAKASKIPIILFEGSSIELGSVCGKPFPVSVLSIYKEGSSNILELAI
jgi:large subunit ribosomal protein L30e